MDFTAMKRRDLQALCKRHGLNAGGSNADLAARLAATLSGSGAAEEDALGVVVGKGCLKRSAAGASGGDSDAAKKVTFVLEEEEEEEPEVGGRRLRSQVSLSQVVANTRGRLRAAQGSQVGGDSADQSDAGEAGADALTRRSRRNAANFGAGDVVERVAGAVGRKTSAKAEQQEVDVGEAVGRKHQLKRKSRENDADDVDVSVQVGVSRRSTRSSALQSEPAAALSPVVDNKRVRKKAGDLKEQNRVKEQPTEIQHVGRTLRSGLVLATPPLSTVSENKRSRSKVPEGETALEKVAELEISGRTTRSSSVATAATSPIVVAKKRRKTENVHSDEGPHTVPNEINDAPVTRVLRNRAVQAIDSTVEETQFGKKMEDKRQPSRTSTRSLIRHLASSVEEVSIEQVAAPCKGLPQRRSRRNPYEADMLLNNNTTSQSSNDLKVAHLIMRNAAKDGVEDGVAKRDGHVGFKKSKMSKGMATVATNGGAIPLSDSSDKASAMDMQVEVPGPVRRSMRKSVAPSYLEHETKGMHGDVEMKETVTKPVGRSTRRSVAPVILERDCKGFSKEMIPEVHVKRPTQKSVVPTMIGKGRKIIVTDMIPEARAGRSTWKPALAIVNSKSNPHCKAASSEFSSAKSEELEKQQGTTEKPPSDLAFLDCKHAGALSEDALDSIENDAGRCSRDLEQPPTGLQFLFSQGDIKGSDTDNTSPSFKNGIEESVVHKVECQVETVFSLKPDSHEGSDDYSIRVEESGGLMFSSQQNDEQEGFPVSTLTKDWVASVQLDSSEVVHHTVRDVSRKDMTCNEEEKTDFIPSDISAPHKNSHANEPAEHVSGVSGALFCISQSTTIIDEVNLYSSQLSVGDLDNHIASSNTEGLQHDNIEECNVHNERVTEGIHAGVMSEAAQIAVPESGKMLQPDVETLALPDEQLKRKPEGNELKGQSFSRSEDESPKESTSCEDQIVLGPGICQTVARRYTYVVSVTDHNDECNQHSEDQLTSGILASDMSEPALVEGSESGIALLPAEETTPFPDEQFTTKLEGNTEQSLILDEDSGNVSVTKRCPSSIEQSSFGLQSLISQDDVQVHEGTVEKAALGSATPECKDEYGFPDEADPHSLKNERGSLSVEQSPFSVPTLFSQESIEEPSEEVAHSSARVLAENRVCESKIVSDHDISVDFSAVSKSGDCLDTSQQDNENEGLTEASHEQEQVAANCMEDADSEEVAYAEENKKPVHPTYIYSSCEKINVSRPVEHASGLSDALLSSSLVASTNDNDVHLSSNSYLFESTDFPDEIDWSNTAALHHGLKKQQSDEQKEYQVTYGAGTSDLIEVGTAKDIESGVAPLPAEETSNMGDDQLNTKLPGTEVTESGLGCDKGGNYLETESVVNSVRRNILSTSSLPKDCSMDDYQQMELFEGFSEQKSPEEASMCWEASDPRAVSATIEKHSLDLAIRDFKHEGALSEDAVYSMKNTESCSRDHRQSSIGLHHLFPQESLKGSDVYDDIVLASTENEDDSNTPHVEKMASSEPDSHQCSLEDLSIVEEIRGLFSSQLDNEHEGFLSSSQKTECVASAQLHSSEDRNLMEREIITEVICKEEDTDTRHETSHTDEPDEQRITLLQAAETSASPDKQLSSELEEGKFEEHNFSSEEMSGILGVGSVKSNVFHLHEDSHSDPIQGKELPIDLSAPKSPEQSAIGQDESVLGSDVSGISQTVVQKRTEEINTKLQHERKEECSKYIDDQATLLSECALFGGSVSGMTLLPTAETSSLPDEQFDPELECDEFEEPDHSYEKDASYLLGSGSVKNNLPHLGHNEECYEHIDDPAILSSGMRKPSLIRGSESGIALQSAEETSALTNEHLNFKMDEQGLCYDIDISDMSDTGLMENNNLSSLPKDNTYMETWNENEVSVGTPAAKSSGESAVCPDDRVPGSVGICQSSGRRRIDEISTKLLSFKISSAVKGSYIAMDSADPKQGDNLSPAALLGNSENVPATKTNHPAK